MRDATAYGLTAPKGDYPAPVRPRLPEVAIPGEDWPNLNVWMPGPSGPGSARTAFSSFPVLARTGPTRTAGRGT